MYITPSFHYGLKGQKHTAQGKANHVSRHPGYNIHQFPLRPERPKAHSPGQGELCEPTPWVFCIHHQLRPEGAKAFSYTICYSCLVVRLLPFQGAAGCVYIIPRVSLPVVACPGLRDAALSGRSLVNKEHRMRGDE